MRDKLFLACLLIFELFSTVNCSVSEEIDRKNKTCTFIFSNDDGDGYEELRENVPQFENCTRKFTNSVLFVKFINFNLPAFPNGTFTNLPILKSFKLEISRGSQIQILSPLLPEYSIFKNLKFETAVIDISDSPSLNGWKWEALSEIDYEPIKRFEFIATKSKITRLPSSFGKIAKGQVTSVRIINCQLKWLSKDVFGPLSKLTHLELYKNAIEKFERYHLPKDASNLRTIDLGKNNLQYISWDLFIDLKVQKLHLNGNKIKVLTDDMDSILASTYLTHIYGALWPCDCIKLSRLIERIKKIEKKPNLLKENCYTNKDEIKTIQDFISITCTSNKKIV